MKWIDELRRLLRNSQRPMAAPAGGVSCEEAIERIFEWLDGELDSELEGRIGAHLETCACCYPMLVFERSFREAVARAAHDAEVPDDLWEGILKRLEEEKTTPP